MVIGNFHHNLTCTMRHSVSRVGYVFYEKVDDHYRFSMITHHVNGDFRKCLMLSNIDEKLKSDQLHGILHMLQR